MHQSSYDHMSDVARRHLAGLSRGTVVDIGSQDVNGSYRPIFQALGWRYRGADAEPGKNVDIVLENPYRVPLGSNSVDLVISGQAFEHIEFFWLSWLEIVRVVKPRGMIFLIAPSRGPEHRYPVDCWRFYPDAWRALAAWGAVKLLEVTTDWLPSKYDGTGSQWGDTVGVFRKPKQNLPRRMRGALLGGAIRTLMPRRRLLGPPGVPAPRPVAPPPAPLSEDSRLGIREPAGWNKRRIASDVPRTALRSIQAGTLRYRYKGVSCLKNPFDLALYTRLFWELRPRSIIEIGYKEGGSALWFADTLRRYDIDGRIYSIDIKGGCDVQDEMVRFLQGDALKLGNTLTSDLMADLPRPLLVIEDSAHLYDTTLATLRFFDPYLEQGEYIVVEDGIVNDLDPEGYAVYENGPNRAILQFLNETDKRYIIDENYCDYYGHNFTFNTNGYLRRLL